MYKFKIFIGEKELSGRQFRYLYIHIDMEITNLLHFGTRSELRQWLPQCFALPIKLHNFTPINRKCTQYD